MHHFKPLFAACLVAIMVCAFSPVNLNSRVKLTDHNKKPIKFALKTQKIEWVNGRVNIAMLSTDNKLLQINNISESLLHDTTFRNRNVQVVYINNNKTYKLNNRQLPLIDIICEGAETGKMLSLSARGKVYLDNAWILFDVTTEQALPTKKFTGASKNSIH